MTLALEPEAAALFTKEQELIRHTEEERVKLVPFVPQSKFMVVDLGGKKYKNEYVIRNYQSKKFKKLKRLQLLNFWDLHWKRCISNISVRCMGNRQICLNRDSGRRLWYYFLNSYGITSRTSRSLTLLSFGTGIYIVRLCHHMKRICNKESFLCLWFFGQLPAFYRVYKAMICFYFFLLVGNSESMD